MDALALLCTLHADGPATLRILRQAGCASLERLEQLDAERLAGLLGLTPASSRRFLRESRNLRARLGDDLLDHEETSTPLGEAQVQVVREGRGVEASVTDAGTEADARLGSRDQSIMDRVLSAWRERDLREPVRHGEYGTDPSPDEFLSRASEGTPEPTPDPALRPGSLDGLTEACCQRLSRVDVRSIEELLARDSLELAEAADLSFTLIERLQFLARRELSSAQSETAQVVSEPEPVPILAPVLAKFSAADSPDRPARPVGAWDFELQPSAPAELRAPAPEPDQPADAAGPFA